MTRPKRPPIIFDKTFNEWNPCPAIKVQWSIGLPVVGGRLVPVPTNANNHNRRAKLVLSTTPNSKVDLLVIPASAGKLDKKSINGSGTAFFTAAKNSTSAFTIVLQVNGKACGAVFGQNFKFAHDVVPAGGTVDPKGPFTAQGSAELIQLDV